MMKSGLRLGKTSELNRAGVSDLAIENTLGRICGSKCTSFI